MWKNLANYIREERLKKGHCNIPAEIQSEEEAIKYACEKAKESLNVCFGWF